MMRTSVRAKGAEKCFLADLGGCSGPVMGSICEGHSWKLFQIALR